MPPDLQINWMRPVSVRGPTPVQLLLDWFVANEDSYLQSRDQFKELRRLAKQLNSRGVKCDLDDILADFQQLQELLLDEATLSHAIFKDLLPHRERLLHLVLVTKQEPDQEEKEEKKPQSDTGKVRNFSWHSPSPTGGPSAMEMLVTWLELNYGKLIRAMEKRQTYKVLEELVEQIKAAGHSGCTFSKVQSQIGHLQLNWRRGQRYAGAMSPYAGRLQKVFKGGKVPSRRHARKNAERTRADAKAPAVSEEGGNKGQSGDRNTFFWLAPSCTGGPCATEIMVTWLERNYGELSRAIKKKQGANMLKELKQKIEASGHTGCTLSRIRSQMHGLQQQVERSQLSENLSPYKARLREIFGGETAPIRRSPSNDLDSDDGNSTESETPHD
ncbi:hypothetical protein PHYSODRAFT_251573 [Phytophthora sojae]|uniref:Uncharacterized protein n=1 Tax=Phytophthora sojae (strain P6497) TaxID=1094619 RepID=G5AES3_PHYSP|nr:hypothetical protein PHYSODRAFT_251573 [Phytophthora sojae]EGZ05713.1 hypothetical protein PHYSODRAFT_251573 [Phytophthora sojae]|eukprot:XP_009538574.1 hypothetical protein PHYSODRAFT_251573 [Phytophthora sojae]